MPRHSKISPFLDSEKRIENHVAGRIRLRRSLLGMGQQELGKRLGITFQQLQKYEKGANRISVGKLVRAAEILDVPLSFFFDGLDDLPNASAAEDKPLIGRKELDLLRAWRAAPDLIADRFLDLLRAATREEAAAPASDEAGHAAPVAAVHDADAQEVEMPVDQVAPPVKRRGRPPKSASVAVPSVAVPPAPADPIRKRRGRPPKATPVASTSSSKSPSVRKQRRARGAVWDPSDIK